jgi:hypothetical protein
LIFKVNWADFDNILMVVTRTFDGHHHRGHLGHLPIAANLIVVVHNPTTI